MRNWATTSVFELLWSYQWSAFMHTTSGTHTTRRRADWRSLLIGSIVFFPTRKLSCTDIVFVNCDNGTRLKTCFMKASWGFITGVKPLMDTIQTLEENDSRCFALFMFSSGWW